MTTLSEWLNKRRELEKKATKGPWTIYPSCCGPAYGWDINEVPEGSYRDSRFDSEHDVNFIADARLSLPQALRIIEALCKAARTSDAFGLLSGEAEYIAEKILNEERSES